MKHLANWFILPLCLSLGSAWSAPVLSLDRVSSGVMGRGGSVSFELRLSGAESFIGAYSLNIHFDPSVLGYLPSANPFGPSLGNPLTESFGVAEVSNAGVLHVDQISLLDTAALESLQSDGFGNRLSELVLASFSFEGLGVGAGNFAFDAASIQFSSAAGDLLPPPLLAPPDGVQVVSEPASAALVGISLLNLLWAKRGRSPKAALTGTQPIT